MTIESVEHWLREWAHWMDSETVGRGYPEQCLGMTSGGIWERFEDLLAEADSANLAVVDAAIRDLIPDYQVAIGWRWLRNRYRVDAETDMEALYLLALPDLEAGMRARGIAV